MDARDKYLRDALQHLSEARRSMMVLATTDWTAKLELESGFHELEHCCECFARNQHAMTVNSRNRA